MTSLPVALRGIHQQRIARVAIAASTMRGRGNAGVVRATRQFLAQIDLRAFGVSNEAEYLRALNEATDSLLKVMPSSARHWGLARKALNIFMRDCSYSRHLSEQFPLQAAERFFELPLDGVVGKKLCEQASELPRWQSIKGLTPRVSDLYQGTAAKIAASKGVTRVDLDAIWWGALDRDNEPKVHQG